MLKPQLSKDAREEQTSIMWQRTMQQHTREQRIEFCRPHTKDLRRYSGSTVQWRSALLEASFHTAVSQHGNKGFHARRAIEFIVLCPVDFPHRVKRRIRFTRQQFKIRFSRNGGSAICLIAHISRVLTRNEIRILSQLAI
jgi:hypothetical protein